MPQLFEDPSPQYRDDDGNIVAGGQLVFTDAATTNAKNVYAERALSTSLGNTVELDAAGRAATAVWLADGLYNVELLDADDVQVWLREDVGVDAGGDTLPDPSAADEDDVLRSDGTDAYWGPISEVPDPSGHSGKYLGTDGEVVQWTAFPEETVYDEDELPGSFTQDNAAQGSFTFGNIRVMWGSDTGPSTGTLKSTKSVTFDVAFSGAPYYVGIGVASASSTGEGAGVSAQYTSPSASGFTANFFAGAEDNGGVAEINSTIPFTYVAIGPK